MNLSISRSTLSNKTLFFLKILYHDRAILNQLNKKPKNLLLKTLLTAYEPNNNAHIYS